MKYNVILWDINKKDFIFYDIFPYLKNEYNRVKERNEAPKTYEEFKLFISKNSMYQWWGRCEYEIVLKDWPSLMYSKKIDVFYQIMMNLDIITKLFMEEINNESQSN